MSAFMHHRSYVMHLSGCIHKNKWSPAFRQRAVITPRRFTVPAFQVKVLHSIHLLQAFSKERAKLFKTFNRFIEELTPGFKRGERFCSFGLSVTFGAGPASAVIFAMAFPGAILQPMSLAVSGSFYPERFSDPRLRFSGVSLGRQLGTILGGGIMPFVAASLVRSAGGSLTWALAYFAAVCALALAAVISSRETAGDAWT